MGAAISTFARSFPIDGVDDRVLEENPWFRDILMHWRPAGDSVQKGTSKTHNDVASASVSNEDPERLRLAIRDGYLNFYRSGQSVAKVGFGRDGGLQARIHNKYLRGDQGFGRVYDTVTAAGVPDQETSELRGYDGPTDLLNWISNANLHVGKEKRFVDLVVARNPDTIDLEMALPAYLLDPKDRKSPRMDLVVLEPVDDRWRIVFWEAKLVDDSRARCRGAQPPEVIKQLAQYTTWLGHAGHHELVAAAYQNVCRLLVEFREIAKGVNPEIEELGPGIVAAAASDAPALLIDDKPRLLIDDRLGNGSFTKNGHLQKLRDEPCNLHVQMVTELDDMILEVRA